MPDFVITLPDPPERTRLEPFATIYAEVIVPEAVAGHWFSDQRDVPDEDLRRISRRIEALLEHSLGHALHPAIYVHALLVCGHFFSDAAEAADSVAMLVQSLVLHHNLNDLYLLLA